jgi:acetyltransferase-like isoleucine patch superfamily enzyme
MTHAQEVHTAPRPAAEAMEVYNRWIEFLDEEFTRHHSAERRAEIVRDQLFQLYLGRPHGTKLNLTLTSELPGNVLTLSLDPENATLEAGHYAGVDREKFDARKPLLWFWQMYDRSPVGLNYWLGLRFRRMLGRHIFARMGEGVKFHHGIELTYGYNLSLGDGVVVRQGAMLDDSGGIEIGDHAVIGSYARIYSHGHDLLEYHVLRPLPTKIGERARIGSHAIVPGGTHVAPGEVIGSFPTGE